MEANRDEAERALERAREYYRNGEMERAQRLIATSLRLYELPQALAFRDQLEQNQQPSILTRIYNQRPLWMSIHPTYKIPLLFLFIVVLTITIIKITTPDLPLSAPGSLPGDFSYHNESLHIYFPFMTSIILSMLFSFLFRMIRG